MAPGAYRRSPGGFLAVVSLHAAVLGLLLRAQPFIPPERSAAYSDLLFITPPRRLPELPAMPVQPKVSTRPARIKPALPSLPIPAADIPVAPVEMPSAETPSPRIDMEALVKQAGSIDRDIRPAGENRRYGPTRESMEAVLNRAFTAAKLAVPPKWYEAARIELFSAPNDTAPIYQISTAFGTYCIFYPDKYKDDGRSRQPKVSSCPIRF